MIIITSKYLKRSVGKITSKIFKKIGGNTKIKNIQRDRWEYLDQKYLKGLVGVPRSKNTTRLSSLNV